MSQANQDEKAVTDITDAEWTTIVDFDGAWERLQAAIERYGQRVAREAYALGQVRATSLREEGREQALRTLASATRKVLSPELVALVEAEMRRGLARDIGIECGNWTPQKAKEAQ